MVESSFRIGIVADAQADRRMICDLIDRIICQEAPWLDPGLLDTQRTWCGASDRESFVDVHDAFVRARNLKLPVYGAFPGHGGAMIRSALLLLAHASPPPAAVVVVWDMDGDRSNRERAMMDTLACRPWPFPVVMAIAHCKRESWVLSGFVSLTPEEEQRHLEEKRHLGFDPCGESEKLTAVSPGAKRSAKRVLDVLTIRDREREAACWRGTDLSILERHGQRNGLSDFLNGVRRQIAPLFAPGAPPTPPGQLSLLTTR